MKNIFETIVFSTGNFSLTIGKILTAFLIIIVAYFFIRFVTIVISRTMNRKGHMDGRYFSIIQLMKYFIWTLTFILVLQFIGIDITFLIASSAAVMVGIGLGLQNVFKDFVSGIILLIEGTIRAEDIVEIDGLVVKVNEISIRTSKVTTREDNVMIIPNHKFIEEKIVNWTNNGLPTRFKIEVGVDYSSDANQVEQILMQCALQHADILSDKIYGPSVRFSHFGNSSLDFLLIFYSYNLFRIENVKSKLRFHILDAFRKNNITIPFPQHVIHYADKESNSK